MKMKVKLFLLVTALCSAGLFAAPVAKVKPFEIKLEPGKTEYTVMPPVSGTFWIVSDSKSLIPVGR